MHCSAARRRERGSPGFPRALSSLRVVQPFPGAIMDVLSRKTVAETQAHIGRNRPKIAIVSAVPSVSMSFTVNFAILELQCSVGSRTSTASLVQKEIHVEQT